MTLLTHLDVCYIEAPLEVKRKMLGSIFPEKLVFENGSYRTSQVSPAIELSVSLEGVRKGKCRTSFSKGKNVRLCADVRTALELSKSLIGGH